MRLNKLRDQAYHNALEHGFHDEEHDSIEHYKCLIISELMEAVEADRKGLRADMDAFDKYEGRISFKENFERHIKDTVDDELADACIRILDLAGYKNIDLETEVHHLPVRMLKGRLFTEQIYSIVHVLVGCEQLNRCLAITMTSIFLLADVKNADINRHIHLKMQYNQSRQRLHGKCY